MLFKDESRKTLRVAEDLRPNIALAISGVYLPWATCQRRKHTMGRTSAKLLLLFAALLSGGCRMCQGPQDYCGPVIRDDLPTLGFCERHNSVLSPGTYSTSQPESAPDES